MVIRNNSLPNRLAIVLLSFAAIFAVFFFAKSSVIAVNLYCGADVCTGSCVRSGNTCVRSGGACYFQNCACTTRANSLVACRTVTTTTCDRCREFSHYEYVYRCRNECIMQNNDNSYGNVYARCPVPTTRVCSTQREAVYKWEDCPPCTTSVTGCREDWTTVSCGGNPPPPPPSCNTEAVCTPTCPAGTVTYNTGGTVQTVSCSYQNGSVVNGACARSTVTKNCYPLVPPVVTTTSASSSPMGCVAAAGFVGKEASNRLQVNITYKEPGPTDPAVALMSWYGTGAPPTITKVYDTYGTDIRRLTANNSFGLLVRKVSGVWSNIYVPGVENGALVWIKAGTIGTGTRAEILGTSQLRLAGINNVTVTATGTAAGSDINLNYTIEFYNSKSNLAANTYQQVPDGALTIYAVANTQNSFLPAGGSTITAVPQMMNTSRTFTIDMTDPTNENLSFSVNTETRFTLNWQFADGGSGIARVIGDAAIARAGTTNGPITDVTQPGGIAGYILGSGAAKAAIYSGTPYLWRLDGTTTRGEVIDIGTNEGGSLDFTTYGFDRACNYTSKVINVPLGDAWLTTKGGLVYSDGGSQFDIKSYSDHARFSSDTYWNDPFGFYKDESDLSTELLSSQAGSLPKLIYDVKLKSVRAVNSKDENNQKNYWYSTLSERVDSQVKKDTPKYKVINIAGSYTTPANSTSITANGVTCTAANWCVVKVAANLNIGSNFSCNARTLFLVQGTVTVNPDMKSSSISNGCMIVAKGNITFAAGAYASTASAYPKFDIVEGFFITDGNILFPATDAAAAVRDGLKINGSVIGFGAGTGRGFVMGKTLKFLFNTQYPAVAVHFDNRYLNFAVPFFGGAEEVFKQEVGFKPL